MPAQLPAAEPEQLRLFELGRVDLTVLRMERAALAEGMRAAATRRAYAADWRDWERWAGEAGRSPLPASADSVSLYVCDLARRGLASATIERRMCALAARHLAAGLASPVSADVRELLSAVRRKLGTEPHAKAALMAIDLARLVGVLPEDARGARDRAVLLLGFASGLRRSELAALQLGDVEIEPRGVRVHLARSKTDQEGAGRVLGVHRGKRAATCPVRALEGWLVERGRWPGPLFCRVGYGGRIEHRGIRPRAIAAIVQAAARLAGLDASKYAGHSLRAGCATEAAARGAAESAIMERTGHRSTAMVRRYIRHGTVFARDPLAGAL